MLGSENSIIPSKMHRAQRISQTTEFPGTLLKRIHRMNQNIERDGIFVKIKEHNEMNTTMK